MGKSYFGEFGYWESGCECGNCQRAAALHAAARRVRQQAHPQPQVAPKELVEEFLASLKKGT